MNAIAADQGLLPIGARADQGESDKLVRQQIANANSQAKEDGRAAVENKALANAFQAQLRDAHRTIEALKLENCALRSELDLLQSGVALRK